MSITLIGGSGFVGTRLIPLLGKNNCKNLDLKPSDKYNTITRFADIRDKSTIKFDSSTDKVILLAAEHRDNVDPPSNYYDVNVCGTKNVLEQMTRSGIKNIIFTSSVAVYGLNKKNPNENHPIDPFNHYGKSKWQAENLIKEWYDNDPLGKTVTIIRPTVIFGERNRGNVYNLIKQISSGRFIMIGSGKNKKSMAYVGNVTSFIKFCIENQKPGYHVYNYSDKPDIDMITLTQLICKELGFKNRNVKIPYIFGLAFGHVCDLLSLVSGKKLPISSVRVKKFCATTQFDSTKAHNEFNSPFSFKKGLRKTLNFEFNNKDTET